MIPYRAKGIPPVQIRPQAGPPAGTGRVCTRRHSSVSVPSARRAVPDIGPGKSPAQQRVAEPLFLLFIRRPAPELPLQEAIDLLRAAPAAPPGPRPTAPGGRPFHRASAAPAGGRSPGRRSAGPGPRHSLRRRWRRWPPATRRHTGPPPRLAPLSWSLRSRSRRLMARLPMRSAAVAFTSETPAASLSWSSVSLIQVISRPQAEVQQLPAP